MANFLIAARRDGGSGWFDSVSPYLARHSNDASLLGSAHFCPSRRRPTLPQTNRWLGPAADRVPQSSTAGPPGFMLDAGFSGSPQRSTASFHNLCAPWLCTGRI